MKCTLIYPPQWMPFNPHLAPAAIQSILSNNGYGVNFKDLNIEFYKTVLTPEFILGSLNRSANIYQANIKKIIEIRKQKNDLKDFPKDFQNIFYRFSELEKIIKQNEYNEIAQKLPAALETIKNKKDFYNLHALEKAFKDIEKATDILSSLYYPSRVNFINVVANSYNNINELVFNCIDKEGNIFYHFYERILPDLLKDNPDFIGISLGDYTQLLPALTLSMMLKKHSNAHIAIGGNLFGRYTDTLINNPEFFKLFADSIMYNEGEKPILELLKHLKGEIEISKVPNLIYLKNNEIKINEEESPMELKDLPPPNYSNFPLEAYYTPEVIFNIQTSRNCYWKKCAFCTHHFGSKYGVKSVEQVIGEIKYLQKNFDAKYFHFVDEAISPAYLKKLSEKIIEENLEMNFYIYGRLEKEFTPELFKLARKAGLRFILWGFESANERIYGLMNKGEVRSSKERQKILQDAFDSDIWNHLFIMFGFPSETLEEAKETVDFLKENKNIISHSTGGKFVLLDNAPIFKDLEKYSINKVEKFRSGFSFAYRFSTTKGMTREELNELEKYKAESWNWSNLKYKNIAYREKVFLYICKYGTKNISKFRDKIWI